MVWCEVPWDGHTALPSGTVVKDLAHRTVVKD